MRCFNCKQIVGNRADAVARHLNLCYLGGPPAGARAADTTTAAAAAAPGDPVLVLQATPTSWAVSSSVGSWGRVSQRTPDPCTAPGAACRDPAPDNRRPTTSPSQHKFVGPPAPVPGLQRTFVLTLLATRDATFKDLHRVLKAAWMDCWCGHLHRFDRQTVPTFGKWIRRASVSAAGSMAGCRLAGAGDSEGALPVGF